MTRADSAALAEVRWMLEELRVSYFAQSLGTAYSVSEKRVLRAIDPSPAQDLADSIEQGWPRKDGWG